MRSALVRRLGHLPTLTLLSALFYGLTGLALEIATIWYFPGKNPREVLGILGAVAIALSAHTLRRGVRFTTAEATGFLAIYLTGAAALSFTTGRDLAAFSNGLVLPMLGLYTGWLLPRRAAPVFYLGLVGWLVAMTLRGDPMLTAMAFVGAGQSVVAVEVAWRLTVRISALMYVDSLTGVLNRAGVTRRAALLIDRAHAERSTLSLAVIDLDDLRKVNNTAGHRAGDAHLVSAVDSWAPLAREGDVVGRIGGDEFVILFPRTDEAAARVRLRALQEVSPVAWTFGVTQVRSDDTYASAAERADLRMYADKHVVHPPAVTAPQARRSTEDAGPSGVTEGLRPREDRAP
ncbi:GGDEF domain-containing protein [Nocardioides sp.]|uniref:GGDEF domain-containing protein n=1 Tax=Nocardioides sp. TaxID=35761 RepID=UPI0026106968|nr:GGDEF domain-containing protein [Nocardioides sp.]